MRESVAVSVHDLRVPRERSCEHGCETENERVGHAERTGPFEGMKVGSSTKEKK